MYKDLKLVTYNMHGFNQGATMLLDLSVSFDVILCQEHWLLSDQLHKLNDMIDDFRCISVSAMDDVCGRGILRGRPFGGLAIFVRNSLCNNFQCLIKCDRVLAVKVGNCIFVCVYLPVFKNSPEYMNILSNIISILEHLVIQNMHIPIIIGGNFNLEFLNGVTRCHAFNQFISSANLFRCETTEATTHTYICETRNASSLIDHFLVNKYLVDKFSDCYAVDSGLNFSDHLPLALHCVSLPLCNCHPHEGSLHKSAPLNKPKRYRWDKADLLSYYYASDYYLSTIDMSCINELCQCPVGCRCDNSKFIDTVYQDIVQSLHAAANDHCPMTTDSFFKSYWDEEMSELKYRSIDTHQVWVAFGRPSSGPIYRDRCHARAEYRRAEI